MAYERLPAEAAAAWAGLFRPGIRLASVGAGPRVGRIGGNPAMPAEVEWPVWLGRGPLNFVAAVDCASLPREFLTVALPEAGMLLFFYFDGCRRPVEDDLALVGDAEGSRVLFVPADVPVVERPAPAGIKPYPGRDLFGEVVATAPEREHVLLDWTKTASGASLAEAVATVLGPGRWGTDVFGELVYEVNSSGPQHQVGGFAAPVQDAVEKEVAAAILEGSWQDPRLAEEAAQWVLLAQIDSDEVADMTWGDVGMLYWLIRTDDLEVGRFDRVRCTMQCG
ncbi:YwqG family protein [Amycolatopsis stemonae]